MSAILIFPTPQDVTTAIHAAVQADQRDKVVTALQAFQCGKANDLEAFQREKFIYMINVPTNAVEPDQFFQDRKYCEKYGPPKIYRQCTFASYRPATPLQTAALACVEDFPWCDADSDAEYKNMVLAGPCGIGKTHLAAALFAHQEYNFGYTMFVTAAELFRQFHEASKDTMLFRRYGDGEATSDDDLGGGCRTLIVDDLGFHCDKASAAIFCEILDRRMNNDLETVVTTNCTKHELLEWLGDRGFSRLMHRCRWAPFDGDDYRLKS